MRQGMWVWAIRDVIRKPAEAVWLCAALGLFVAIIGTPLLFTNALSQSVKRLLADAPSIVVRKIEAGGFAPMPVQEGLAAARKTPGVLNPRTRVWGVVNGPSGPVTVVGIQTDTMEEASVKPVPYALGPGQAIAGAGVETGKSTAIKLQNGPRVLELQLILKRSSEPDPAVHDMVLLNVSDARFLLNLNNGFASDLALDVFHETEAAAIVPDLAEAFAWPVHIEQRGQVRADYTETLYRRSGVGIVMLIPGLLLLLLLIFITVKQHVAGRYEVGLYKAFGWRTVDIVRLHIYRALVTGLPALAAGMTAAYFLVFGSGAGWVGRLLLGWDLNPPDLELHPGGSFVTLIEIGALVMTPYLTATLWATVSGAAADPEELLNP
jgi:hypothetical protein